MRLLPVHPQFVLRLPQVGDQLEVPFLHQLHLGAQLLVAGRSVVQPLLDVLVLVPELKINKYLFVNDRLKFTAAAAHFTHNFLPRLALRYFLQQTLHLIRLCLTQLSLLAQLHLELGNLREERKVENFGLLNYIELLLNKNIIFISIFVF
jgi:hypothetical protein